MTSDNSDGELVSHRLKVLHEFADAYNRHDVDAIMEFMTEDCSFISYFGPEPFGERFEGAEMVRRRVVSFLQDVPDARWENARHFVSGDRGVSQWTYSGTRNGTKEKVTREGCDLFTFRGDRILVKDTYQKILQPPAVRREIRVPSIHKPLGRYAHAVRHKDMVFISGCGPFDAAGELVGAGDIVAQTTQTLQNVKSILEAAGLSFANVLKETIFLTDIGEGVATRMVREQFYGSVLPAATLLEISRCVHPDMKIEIEVIAGA
ncbi:MULTISPECIES: Rid family hydrolase [unclassified Sinorhizobium]|uniref:Rid family hydrolase n=1 Tax=unclassified Sinorhizobium TaxID=2613772 RepID=UPI003525F06C